MRPVPQTYPDSSSFGRQSHRLRPITRCSRMRHPSGSCAGDHYTSAGCSHSRKSHLSRSCYGDRDLSPVQELSLILGDVTPSGTRRPAIPGPFICLEAVQATATLRPAVLFPFME